MASIEEMLQQKQGQWENVRRAFAEYQTAWDDFTTFVDATNQVLRSVIRSSDDFVNREREYNGLLEEYNLYESSITHPTDNSDWDAIQEFMNTLDMARAKYTQARDEFLG